MTDLIVWDEAPAQNRHCFEAVDCTLKDLRNSTKWFGGITMVFAGTFHPPTPLAFTKMNASGDFHQCLPVLPKASRAQIVASTITCSIFWKDVTILRLTTNMRLLANSQHMTNVEIQHANDFTDWLLRLGEGALNDSEDTMMVQLPEGSSYPHSHCLNS